MLQNGTLTQEDFDHIRSSAADKQLLADVYEVSSTVIDRIQQGGLQAAQVVGKDAAHLTLLAYTDVALSWADQMRSKLFS